MDKDEINQQAYKDAIQDLSSKIAEVKSGLVRMTLEFGNQVTDTSHSEPMIFWDTLKSCVLALSVMLFFSGWFYLYFYFRQFGLSLNDVSFEVTSFYMYAFTILLNPLNFLLTFGVLILAFVLYYKRSMFERHFYLVSFLMAVLYFPLEYLLAKKYASENSNLILTGQAKINPVYFNFKGPFFESLTRGNDTLAYQRSDTAFVKFDSMYTSNLLRLNTNLSLFLFYQNDDSYYVFYNPNKTAAYQESISIFTIPKTDISYTSLSIDKQN